MSAASNAPGALGSTVAYGRQLVGSGLQGAGSAARRALGTETANAALARAARFSWKPGVAAACLGIVASALRKRSAGNAVLNGLASGAVAFSAAMMWSSHELTTAAARGAVAGVNAARDAHWLDRNPIDYA